MTTLVTLVPPQPKPRLGRLERVDLRAIWTVESQDFTPWLAQGENIALLGEAIGLELEVDSTEKGVGPYRADILCKDTVNDQLVLIENQLERTDHIHLGQLLTYAAGLEAATVVWVARQFTDEHRAALDWLNLITDSRFNFFGLEIELWRIGDSAVAPKFNVVSQPNDWSKAAQQTTGAGQGGTLSETQQLHLEYWTQLKQYVVERGSPITFPRPAPRSGVRFSLGSSNFALNAWNIRTAGESQVSLRIEGPQKAANYQFLYERRDALEQQLGSGPLRWTDPPDKQVSNAWFSCPSNLRDRSTWPELNRWFAERLEKMNAVLRPIVRALDAAGDVPQQAEASMPGASGDGGLA